MMSVLCRWIGTASGVRLMMSQNCVALGTADMATCLFDTHAQKQAATKQHSADIDAVLPSIGTFWSNSLTGFRNPDTKDKNFASFERKYDMSPVSLWDVVGSVWRENLATSC